MHRQPGLPFLTTFFCNLCGGPSVTPPPDPRACRVDADCRSGPLVNPQNACCQR